MQVHTWPLNKDAASRMPEAVKQTQVLAPDRKGIGEAADILRRGGLVAFPTETVYGLGADARDDTAVARIFDAKARPSFNPLIVHVADLAAAERYGILTDAARDVAKSAWPGPLSIVVPLRDDCGLSHLVTAGQSSVALRVPSSDIALELLKNFGGPVAAPSANRSGRISPTTAQHVLSGLDGRIEAVIDGGATREGLESTILDFRGETPVLLREGAFDASALITDRRTQAGEAPIAPGQLASHYAPVARVRLNAAAARPGEFLLGFGAVTGDISLSPTGDLVEAAANLYAMLHEVDARGVERLAVAPIPDVGLGRAINDRLRRAAAPRG